MIEARRLEVRLDGRAVVDGVDLDVARGEWLTIIGPNGAGKTTLLRVLAGLAAASGRIVLDSHETGSLGRRHWSQLVGLVPQTPLVPRGMTVAEYVLLGRTPHLRPLGLEGPADLAAAHDALVRLDLLPFAQRNVDTLSGGELQRVLVARLLAQDAPIALLDEPTTALDVGHQQQVLDLVEELRRDRELTVVATMHDLTIAGQYGDRMALMVDGRIAVQGTAQQVLTRGHLEEHYGARVEVVAGEDGPIVVPVRAGSPR